MFISFGQLTKKSYLFLVTPIVTFIRIMLINPTSKSSLFYHWFLKFLGRSISGLLWFAIERTIISIKKEKQYNKDTKLVEQNIPQDDILKKDEVNRKSSIYIQYELDYYKKKKM